MGFFSWECLGCWQSLRSPGGGPHWMQCGVAFSRRVRQPIEGCYDGYGDLGGHDLRKKEPFSLYHEACADILEPQGFTKKSPWADDQGYTGPSFPRPQSVEDLKDIRRAAVETKIEEMELSIDYQQKILDAGEVFGREVTLADRRKRQRKIRNLRKKIQMLEQLLE